MYVEPWKDSVGVFGAVSVEEDVVVPSPLNVPKRLSAITSGQRCAAQYGQYSAPR